MKIIGFEKLSLVDFDKHLTCTIFLSGCNYKCLFCHNSSLANDTSSYSINKEEILRYLKKRSGVLDSVCITGGEATLNDDLIDFIKEIKELNYLVKLDTNGTNIKMLKELVDKKLIDYCAMDIKSSIEKYSVITQTSFSNDVIESINYLLENHIDYEFRTTIVSEFVNEEEIIKIGKLIKGCKRYYLQKFQDNENCIMRNLHEVDITKANEYKDLLRQMNVNTYLRGY